MNSEDDIDADEVPETKRGLVTAGPQAVKVGRNLSLKPSYVKKSSKPNGNETKEMKNSDDAQNSELIEDDDFLSPV